MESANSIIPFEIFTVNWFHFKSRSAQAGCLRNLSRWPCMDSFLCLASANRSHHGTSYSGLEAHLHPVFPVNFSKKFNSNFYPFHPDLVHTPNVFLRATHNPKRPTWISAWRNNIPDMKSSHQSDPWRRDTVWLLPIIYFFSLRMMLQPITHLQSIINI